jgi:hypothetical protein
MKIAVLAIACACAASGQPFSSSQLEAEFSGTWTGTATLALAGKNPVPYSVALVVAASGNTATVKNPCPGLVQRDSMRQSSMRLPTEGARPASSIDATGSGASAAWSGNLDCPKVEMAGCAEMAPSYTNATMTLTGTNQLTVVVSGRAEGCGVGYPLLLTFVGAK